jgi:renalase
MNIAIIGAGIAGLTTAFFMGKALRQNLTIFEKSRGLGGRAATRWFDRPEGRVYVDHGAQYFKTESKALRYLMLEVLPRQTLHDIGRPLWLFDQHNNITEGDPTQNAAPKWSYSTGAATLGKLLASAAGLQVGQQIRTEVRVGRIDKIEAGFALRDTNGVLLGTYEQVVMALPSAQAADLVAASNLPAKDTLAQALQTAEYRRCCSVALGYNRRLAPRPYYALLNSDKQHELSWLAYEHDKPGHVPEGLSVLVAQMAGPFSLANWDTEKDQIMAGAAQHVSALLGEDLTKPDWYDLQKWKFAQPEKLADSGLLNGQVEGLWFTGDYLAGGKVHLAAQNGMELAELLALL